MKKLLTLAAGLGLVFTIAGTVTTASAVSNPSDYPADAIAGGVVNSRHNMGASGVHFRADNADSNGVLGGTSEVCIFCHTPHHGSTNAPLWNKGAQSVANYTTYGTTVAGTSADTSPGAATLACLSCHDGVNTFDTIVNWPGKDGKGNNQGGTTTDMGYIFTEDGATMSDYMTSGRLNLGTTLTNDHPVSIDYTPTSAASLRTSTTTISAIDLTNDVFSAADGSLTESALLLDNRWSVGGYIDTGATVEDLLRGGKVECSSCHDPHFKNQSWDEVAVSWDSGGLDADVGSADMDGLFLRRVGGNSLSGVCRTCHNK
jgi:hypothetical protein